MWLIDYEEVGFTDTRLKNRDDIKPVLVPFSSMRALTSRASKGSKKVLTSPRTNPTSSDGSPKVMEKHKNANETLGGLTQRGSSHQSFSTYQTATDEIQLEEKSLTAMYKGNAVSIVILNCRVGSISRKLFERDPLLLQNMYELKLMSHPNVAAFIGITFLNINQPNEGMGLSSFSIPVYCLTQYFDKGVFGANDDEPTISSRLNVYIFYSL